VRELIRLRYDGLLQGVLLVFDEWCFVEAAGVLLAF
jgi:hypothetical protein